MLIVYLNVYVCGRTFVLYYDGALSSTYGKGRADGRMGSFTGVGGRRAGVCNLLSFVWYHRIDICRKSVRTHFSCSPWRKV